MKKVLSVQSHVVHGYVGNKAATFPLQLQGWDVDALNTVQFSNHTGYGLFRGTRTTGDELSTIYSGLKEVGFEYDAVLTGYVPSAEGVRKVGEIGQDLKKRFPKAIWLLDPVMGDDGHLYVAEEVIPAYKDILDSGAVTLITPNQFEAEILTGKSIGSANCHADAQHVIAKLFEVYKVPNVVITSIKHGDNLVTFGATSFDKKFDMFYFEYPAYDMHFTGTGDLFSALLLEKFHYYTVVQPPRDSSKLPLEFALHDTLSIMDGVLKRTQEHAISLGIQLTGERGNPDDVKHLELQIIQSKDIISGQPAKFKSEARYLS